MDYDNATQPEHWKYVRYLKAAAPAMLKTRDRNIDEDLDGKEAFKDIPLTNDFSEGIFAHWDRAARNSPAGIQAVKGQVMARTTHALDTDAQRTARATEKVKQGIRNGSLEGDYEELLNSAIMKENLLNYFQYDKEERYALLIEARSALKVRCVCCCFCYRVYAHFSFSQTQEISVENKIEEQEEAEEKLKRKRMQTAQERDRCKKKYDAYHALSDVVVISSDAEFRKVIQEHNKPGSRTDFCEICRDQLRLQMSLFGVPA